MTIPKTRIIMERWSASTAAPGSRREVIQGGNHLASDPDPVATVFAGRNEHFCADKLVNHVAGWAGVGRYCEPSRYPNCFGEAR